MRTILLVSLTFVLISGCGQKVNIEKSFLAGMLTEAQRAQLADVSQYECHVISVLPEHRDKPAIAGYADLGECQSGSMEPLVAFFGSAENFDTERTLRCFFAPNLLVRMHHSSGEIDTLIDSECGRIDVRFGSESYQLNAFPGISRLQPLVKSLREYEP